MKIINKICAPSRWKQYLLTGLLINGLLSFLVQAMIFFIRKKGLSAGLSLGIDAGGMLIGLVFILFVVDLQVENEFAQKKFLFKKVLRKPVIILVTLAVCLWFTLGEGAVNLLFGIMHFLVVVD